MIEANGVRTAAAAARGPSMGQFVSLRGRLWLVEEQPETPFDGHRLACVDDDASGEDAQVLWSAEVDARLRDEEAWASLASGGGDAETFSAYLRTVRWRTATAAERDLFQAPFRAGIRLDPYQLLPLRKALRLPRVNLLIADDVGLGKTVEAGLVLREMLLRRRVDYMVVLAPAAMTGQWRDELQTKFGLSFEIIDRQHLESLRRRRGYGANPWATGSRFILSHRLLGDEAYVAGLRDVLEEFRARSLLILDEAHHAAPAGGGRYAVESQFTRSLRDLSDRFEHRLFLSATPHNGHPNSFATLLELLDPQRFTRGVPVRPADLEPVMVRRLKSDLRALGEAFPERVVEPVVIDGLDRHAPELRLAAMLADYRALRERRIGTLGAAQGARARLAFVGLQQRLLSSVPAFARTLRVHLAGLERLIAGETAQPVVADEDPDAPERADEEDAAFERLDRAEAVRTEAAAMAAGGAAAQLMAERDHAAAMLVVADAAKTAPDARVRWIIDWARANLLDAEGRWRDRRLILFTEYEDTRRWLQRQLSVLLDPADADEVARIESFTGVTSTERREAIKRAFNDPASPLRILLCTDAAREGINLQAQCHDLIHVDLPWNPSRLEQRNGRIDRKLQPSDTVTCRYFVYAQRPEDVVLDALVRKTEAIRRQLGSAGEVLGDRIADRLGRGIDRVAARDLAERIRDEEADERVRAAVRDLDDGEEARRARLMREQADLAAMLDKAQARVGVDPGELQAVVGLALARAGGGWGATGAVGDTPVFALDQAAPAFAGDPSWQPMLDELRARGPKPGERPGEWRASADAGVRRVSFAPAILPDGRDAGDVVQLHLEHRLVRRLLGRFLSAGFQQGLDRACVIETPATPAPRVVLIGRLALYGERAARLHEEVLSVAADWRDREGDGAALRPLAEGRDAEARVLDELIAALAGARTAGAAVARRATAHALADVGDLRSVLEGRAAARGQRVAAELAKRAASEAAGLETLLGQRIARIRRERGEDDRQFALLLDPAEARQRAADRRSWERAATRLDDELVREPERLRAAARVRATRLEPIGLVYLWPAA